MRRYVIIFGAMLALLLLLLSCSSSSDSNITLPEDPVKSAGKANAAHKLLGLWEFMYDPNSNTLEYTQLRVPDMHLNVLPFLEPPVLLYVTIEGGIHYDIINNTLTVNIGLAHPFLGLNEFAGFDVKGVCISKNDLMGSIPSSTLRMPGPTVLRVLNADGYTRMWNPDEFPYNAENEVFGFKDGLLGAPTQYVTFDAQLNGYKYFCEGLGPDDPVTSMQLERRGLFMPGTKVIRKYILSMPQGQIFQYAIDASWEFPQGDYPWMVPDDYPITANSPEAYIIDHHISGLMFSEDGGSDMQLTITVFDHQPGSITDVYMEAKDLYYEAPPAPPAVWHAAFQYSTQYTDVYTVDIHNKEQVPAGLYPAIICVVDKEINYFISPNDPPEYYTAYSVFDIPVTQKPNVSVTLEEDAAMKGYPGFNVDYIYDAEYFALPPAHIVNYTDSDGPWEFSYAYHNQVILESLPLGAPEVAAFVPFYPNIITHFYHGTADYGTLAFEPYMGEMHDFATNTRKVYGMTETELITGTYIFNNETAAVTPMEFIYPYYYGTDFTAIGRVWITGPIPIEAFEFNWHVRGWGEGKLKLDPAGPEYDSLLMRHDISLELNNVEYAKAIIYEWLIDDGTPLAYIVSGEAPILGYVNNFDSASGIIYGQSIYHVLQGY